MRLTQTQINLFHDQGYLQVDDALGPQDLDPIIWEYEGIIDRKARRLYAENKITTLHERAPFDRAYRRRWAGEPRDWRPPKCHVYPRPGHLQFHEEHEVARHCRVADRS